MVALAPAYSGSISRWEPLLLQQFPNSRRSEDQIHCGPAPSAPTRTRCQRCRADVLPRQGTVDDSGIDSECASIDIRFGSVRNLQHAPKTQALVANALLKVLVALTQLRKAFKVGLGERLPFVSNQQRSVSRVLPIQHD